MADQKISQLTSLTGADAATNDVVPIVDVSASTTKKMTREEFFKNTPSIGIGTDTPTSLIHVASNGVSKFKLQSISGVGGGLIAWHDNIDNRKAYVGTSSNISDEFVIWVEDVNPIKLATNNIERMRIDPTGNVGIGDNAPSVALAVVGDIHYTGTITDVSDRRLKENVQNLSGSLGKICQLEAKSYTLIADRDNENTEVELGFIAQEVQPVFPEIVKEVQKFSVDENGELTDQEVNYLGVSYIQLVAPMVEAIKELKLKNDALEARVAALGG